MLSKKSKTEQSEKSLKNLFSTAPAAASRGRTCTKACSRFLVGRCGPSPRRASDTPAARKKLVHQPRNTFSTASVKLRLTAHRESRQLRADKRTRSMTPQLVTETAHPHDRETPSPSDHIPSVSRLSCAEYHHWSRVTLRLCARARPGDTRAGLRYPPACGTHARSGS
jgi:hypothetical protein